MATTKKKKPGKDSKKTPAVRSATSKGKGSAGVKRQAVKKAVQATAANKRMTVKKGGTRATASKSRVAKKATGRTPARTRSTPKSAAGGLAAAAVAQETGPMALTPPPHILVFVPGFLGSKLRDKRTGKIVWLDFSSVPLNPLDWEGWLDDLFTEMRYPNPNLEPAGLIDDVMFLPPWIKQEQYGRLLKMFENWGYAVDPVDPNASAMNAYTAAYDWRQDQRISARLLGERLKELRALHPGKQVWLMGHSGGGIISRWLIEKEGGDKLVDRLFLLASPWDGSPKALHMLFQGMDTLFRLKFNAFGIPERTREALRTFPAIYQLIPQARSFLRRANGEAVDPFDGAAWLDNAEHIALLQDGRRFNQELGNHLSVKDTVSFLGRKLETTIGGALSVGEGARWQTIDWLEQEMGDGTLPEYSAFFEDARVNVPVVADHGEIYISPALIDLLRVELIDKYIKLQAETIADKKPETNATLHLNREAYAPGETVEVEIRLRAVQDGAPVTRATCKAQVNWLQPLPGSGESAALKALPAMRFKQAREMPGVYRGSFRAPASEGYYQLETHIKVPRQKEITLHDMFVVEDV